MRSQRSLPIGGSLHRFENLFHVGMQAPSVRCNRFGKPHLSKHGKAGHIVPGLELGHGRITHYY